MKINEQIIGLDYGAGGEKSWHLFKEIRRLLKFKTNWQNYKDDTAVFGLGKKISFYH